jgi:hypothetical protein
VPSITWTQIPNTLLGTSLPSAPPCTVNQAWLLVLESFGEANILRIKASGSWTPLEGLPACGPDGLMNMNYPDTGLILSDCSVGALLGRIGGSSASIKAASADAAAVGETKPFPIGTSCIYRLPEKAIGPLFVGFNCLSRPVRIAAIVVSVESARV